MAFEANSPIPAQRIQAISDWLTANDRSQRWLFRQLDISVTYGYQLMAGTRNEPGWMRDRCIKLGMPESIWADVPTPA